MMENGGGENDPVSQLFDQFCQASTCRSIISTFQQLCDQVGLSHADHRNFYRKLRARIHTWKAHALWVKLDKRANHKEYRRGEACANTRVIIIGGGICGLRVAIETALLGARTVIVEKRDRFSRNNVLHLWPFLIVDLKNLGAKKFYGKFCAGAIDHISIRQLQCILLKAALLVGVEIHTNVSFEDIIEPTAPGKGWRVKIDPENHPLSEYEFDVLIGADGKRNTLQGFKRKEFRGKLAIAITANFINKNTQAEARVEEISGVAFIFNQKFFKDLNEACGIDLENIVYYKDETHYFVMTAKKQSLLDKGVLKKDYNDTAKLLGYENVNQEALANYAREAADFSTKHMMPHLDFAVNHYGRPDLAMFDFTSLFQAENACRVVEREGSKLLTMLVGDSLLEPFWPTGSGCARGFLGAFDAAWMIKQWSSGKMTPLQVIAERESVYQLLSQTTPENLRQNHSQFTLDPASRYTNLKAKWLKPKQVMHLYDTGENTLRDEVIEIPKSSQDDIVDTYSLLRWCQKILNTGKYHTINVTDLSSSWSSGLAFCALVHFFKPEAIDYESLNEADVERNNQLAFDVAQQEFGINPVMSGQDMASWEKPDKLTIVSYLSQFYDLFKKQRPPSDDYLNGSFEDNRKHRSPSHRLSILHKLRSSRVSLSKLKKSIKKEKDLTEEEACSYNENNNNYSRENVSKLSSMLASNLEHRDIQNGNIELTRFSKLPLDKISTRLGESNAKNEIKFYKTRDSCPKLPMDEITNRLTAERPDQLKDIKMKEEMMPVVKVSKMAELLVSKFKKNSDQPPPELLGKKVKGQPMMVAAQPASEFCFFCGKRVYLMERMSVENLFFHHQCFKCDFCGIQLRSNLYAVDKNNYGDAYRFFCQRHSLPQSRFGKPARKRVAEDASDADRYKANIPSQPGDLGPTPTKVSATSRSPKKTPAMLSPVSDTEDLIGSMKTPERIEFENTIEGLQEETEEEQWEHNMSMSLSRDAEMDAGIPYIEDDSDDSDLEGEDDGFQEAVDLYNSGRLEESICLAKESLRHSRENLLEGEDVEEDTEVDEYEESEMEDSDTEMEEDSVEPTSTKSNSQTDTRSTPASRSEPLSTHQHTSSNKTSLTNGTSKASRSQMSSTASQPEAKPSSSPNSAAASLASKAARADFFTSPPEPVRLDPFKLFGMARNNPPKEEPVVQSKTNGEVKSPSTPSGEHESDEATDSQVGSHVLDSKGHRSESNNTDEDLDDAFMTAEYTPLLEDDEKVAVSRAMEQLLVDMDHRSESQSDSNHDLNASSDGEGDDDVFHQYRRQLSSRDSIGSRSGSVHSFDRPKSKNSLSSSDFDKKDKSLSTSSSSVDKLKKSDSELDKFSKGLSSGKSNSGSLNGLGSTEKSVLRSVQQMSDNSGGSTGGSGETTLQVLQSVREMKEPENEEIERCIQYLDDRFVTRRDRRTSGKSKKSSRELVKSGSSESFTISTPSHSSRHTSTSSLSEEFEHNKQFLESDDERPDSDMMKDYQMTLSQALEEDNEEEEPVKTSPREEEDLDQTINAEEVNASSPKSVYLSPRSEPGDLSPGSKRNSSVYETPETSLTENSASEVKQIGESVYENLPKKVENVAENVGKVTKAETNKKSILPSFVQTKLNTKPDTPKCVQNTDVKKKKISVTKPPKKIKQEHDEVDPVRNSTKTIIRAYRNGSREGSVEANHLEKDAWGSSSSTGSLNSMTSAEASQKTWRPLPPVPTESQTSPKQSKTVKQSTGRKLPDPGPAKSPVVFQSNFMKKTYTSNTDSNDSSSPSPNVFRKPAITSQPRPLPPAPIERKQSESETKALNNTSESSGLRTKITVDYTKLNLDKDSASESETKKKRIPVASALKNSLKPSLSGNVVEDNSDSIPFADDSENDGGEDKFFTPATSIKPKRKAVRREDGLGDVRKRILPTPPKSTEPAMLSPDRIRDICKAEAEKAREEARQRARLKSDEELGLKDTPSVSKYKRTVSVDSQNNTNTAGEKVSDTEDLRTPLQKISVSFTPEIPVSNGSPKHAKGKKKKKSKSRESSVSSCENLDVESKKEKKKRSLLAIFTPSGKQKELKEKSSSNDTLEDKSTKKKKSKTPKSEKKEKKKKRKTQSLGNAESSLSENMNQLKIGAVFLEKAGPRPGLRNRISPPKASVDDFTDSDSDLQSLTTSRTSLNDTHSRRFRSEHSPLTEEEVNARITRKIQHAARKQQKQQEQKRLRQAQEIQRKIQEVDVKQRELEERGVSVERALRGEGPEGGRSETELMQEWFNLVHEKNALVRLESELMVSARELELEDRQGRLQHQLRESMAFDDSLKSPQQREREQRIYNELIEVVEERDKLVAMLEEERVREREEDKDLENVMRAKGFSLSPTSGSKILRQTRDSKPS